MPKRLDTLSPSVQNYLLYNLFVLSKDIDEPQFRKKMMLGFSGPPQPYFEIRTPLQNAAEMGAVEIVKELLANGANVSLADGPGSSPLMEAIKNKHPVVINILCDKIREQAVALLWDLKTKPTEIIVKELTRFINFNAIHPFDEDEYVTTLDDEMINTKDLYNQTLEVLKEKVLNPILSLLQPKKSLRILISSEELKKLLVEMGFDLNKGVLQESSKTQQNLLNFVVSQGSKEFFWMVMYLGYKELGSLVLMLRFHKPCLFLEPDRSITEPKERRALPRGVIPNIFSFLEKPFSDNTIPVVNPQLITTAISAALSIYDEFWTARQKRDNQARQEAAQQRQQHLQQPGALCFSPELQSGSTSSNSQSNMEVVETQHQTQTTLSGHKRKQPSNSDGANNNGTNSAVESVTTASGSGKRIKILPGQ